MKRTTTITYREALNQALREEMEYDPGVFLMGQSIAERGGSFGVTRGLVDQFGKSRVIDVPIAEASFTGMAVGAAIQGKRPVVELSFIDFATLALDQIINQAAKYSFLTGEQVSVPMVVRTQGGVGDGYGAQHSQSLEALFYHIPGLKVVMPSLPSDAKGLLKSAIRDDGPVIFIEHKKLYGIEEKIDDSADSLITPLGKAAIRRDGSDCTLVTYSRMVYETLDSAEKLAGEDVSCEVIDLRTLTPMDYETISESVRKTGKLVVISEAVGRGSVASDIAGWASEHLWHELKAPIRRVCGLPTPIPFNESLEQAVIPHAADIVEAVKSIM